MTLTDQIEMIIGKVEDLILDERFTTGAEMYRQGLIQDLREVQSKVEGKVLVKPEVVDYGDGKYKAFVSKHWEGFTCGTVAEAVISLEDVIEGR